MIYHTSPLNQRTAEYYLYGSPITTLEQLQKTMTEGPEPVHSTAAELYRKPGESAGVLPGAHVIGDIPAANLVQTELPGWSPILHRFWNQLTAPVEFNLEHAGPTAGFPLVKQPVLEQAASAVGISPNGLRWIGIGLIVLAAGMALRK